MTSEVRQRALRMLDDATARMGSDPCICSIDGVIEEIADRIGGAEQEDVRELLRRRLGLHV
jgi:hypothetical protein